MPENVNVNLDRGYDNTKSRGLLAELGFTAEIARKGIPAPIQAGKRWVIERTHSWMNGYGKLRNCTEKNGKAVDFHLQSILHSATIRRGTIHRPPCSMLLRRVLRTRASAPGSAPESGFPRSATSTSSSRYVFAW